MSNFSENYQLRKCFLQTETVPTQSMIKEKMSPALAGVYFKSMTSRLKVLAGLEPPLKGGGNDWFMPPEDLLQGKPVLKPLKKEYMSQWCWHGADEVGMRMVQVYREGMLAEGQLAIAKNDQIWPLKVNAARDEEFAKCSDAACDANFRYLNHALHSFEVMYYTSITKLENLLFDAAVNKIKEFRAETFKKMQTLYEHLLRQQATRLYDKYTNKLITKKAKLKDTFIRDLEVARTALGNKIHDINADKHIAVEKLRHLMACQTLACRIYVALKEKQECSKKIELVKHEHTKIVHTLTDDIKFKDFKILLAEKKEQKRLEHEKIWKKKVCHVVKKLQMFVLYSLKMLPEHADFFINMEKLMLLQLSEALENPKAASMITDSEPFQAPVANPHPFYLFCEKTYKPKLNQEYCPKHCTSSASQMPVIVINKRCIYAACDNFEQFTDKIKDYVHGRGEKYMHFKDYHDYSRDVPVKYTRSQQLQELKLESSLLQVLQQEIINLPEVPIVCKGCNIPHCFDCNRSTSISNTVPMGSEIKPMNKPLPLPSIKTGTKKYIEETGLGYEKEPKWESYSRYIKSKKCDCAKMAKKHLLENLPIYMRKMSFYEEPELLNYEKCSVGVIKSLVKEATGSKTIPRPTPKVQSKTKELATQCSNEFEYLCTCFSDDSVINILKSITDTTRVLSNIPCVSEDNEFNVVGTSMSSTYLAKEETSFATGRALSLRRLIDQSPEIKEIFTRTNCIFD